MATLSKADQQNLSADQQKQVLALKQQWEAANMAGNTAEMEKAHKAAEAIRAASANGAYSGGSSGNSYKSLSNGGGNPYMSSSTANGNGALSKVDNALLNAEQQQQIANLKAQWAQANAANDQTGMELAHQQAEAIRQSAGYSGGTSGAGYNILGANAGGMTADDMAKWLADYQATNYKTGRGWTNGYSTAMNVRSKANKIRQQMLANEQAQAGADDDTKRYLHEQNLALAQLLYQYTGHTDKTTWYNEEKGRWETENPDVGYGYHVLSDDPSYTDLWKKHMGYTDEDIQRFANDTSYYYNFVDPRLNRLAIDESRGYTGQYSQFANGPYGQLLGAGTHDGSVNPSIYEDVNGDGFGNEGPLVSFTPIRDENGNVLNAQLPELKNNNSLSDYTNQFTSYVQGGVIQPGILAARNPGASGDAYGAYTHKTGGSVDGSDPRYTGGINRDVAASTPDDPNNLAGQLAYWQQFEGSPEYLRQYGSSGSSGSSGGTYEDYINQMYAAALEAQMAQLKSSYDQNISDLNAEKGTVDDTYTEQKRQTTGTNAQQAANWREMANAYGLNSGTIGQAALAQNNQLQSNLNTLESAQAAAQAEIERQRTLMGQQYQLQINQAMAENNFQRAEALYQEAVRADEALRQQQQFNANLALQYAQLAQQQSQFDAEMALSMAKAAGSGSGSSGGSGAGYIAPQNYTTDQMFAAIDASGMDPAVWLSSKDNRKQYGFDGYSASSLEKAYDKYVAGGNNLSSLRNIVSSSPTYTTAQKAELAMNYYDRGDITYDQLRQFLKENGIET